MTATSRPTILVGGSGFVGTHVRREFAARDAAVTLVSRSRIEAGPHERVCPGDLTASDSLVGQLPRDSVVINLAYDARGGHDANLAMADGLASICRRTGVRRLVHLSTALVVGVVDDLRVDERTRCRPRTEYQRTKLDVEHRLAEGLAGVCPLVVLRPTAVFGEGGLNLRKLASDLTGRSALENYLRACLFGRRPMNLVPVETVAAAIAFSAVTPLSHDVTTWLVADDEVAINTFAHVERTLRAALERRSRVWPVLPMPVGLLTAVLKMTGRLSFDPRTRFGTDAIEQAGFVRPVTFQEALQAFARSVRDVRESGR